MKYALFEDRYNLSAIDLFSEVFTASEGRAEGQFLHKLVTDLLLTTHSDELIGFAAIQEEALKGAIFFSRMQAVDGSYVWLLSPVAVAVEFQGQGIGQKLISFGLNYLRDQGEKSVVTYGDPSFYSKVGFYQIEQNVIQPPYPLSQPIGWMGLRLDGHDLEPIEGKMSCVKAFADPSYW